MPENPRLEWLQQARFDGPAEQFVQYCQRELERRQDAEPNADLALYEQAVRLVLQKLGVSGEEELR